MANNTMDNETQSFIKKHEPTIAILLSTVAIIFTVVFGGWSIQKDYNDKFIELQKQFNTTIEKIGKVDGDARVRDKELELLIVKNEK